LIGLDAEGKIAGVSLTGATRGWGARRFTPLTQAGRAVETCRAAKGATQNRDDDGPMVGRVAASDGRPDVN